MLEPHFKERELFFLVPPDSSDGEWARIDEMMDVLESSDVWRIVDDSGYKDSPMGRSSYDQYNMLAMIIYCFAMRKGGVGMIALFINSLLYNKLF